MPEGQPLNILQQPVSIGKPVVAVLQITKIGAKRGQLLKLMVHIRESEICQTGDEEAYGKIIHFHTGGRRNDTFILWGTLKSEH